MATDEPTRIIDLALLGQTSFDSAMPSGSAVLAHPLPSVGDYVVSRLEGRSLVRSHAMSVHRVDAEPVTGPSPAPALQFADADVRLPGVDRTLDTSELDDLRLREGGYMSFTGAAGNAHTVRVQQVAKSGRASTVWDSTKAGDGDVYALSLARPGTYRLQNTADGAEARVVVSYPRRGSRPYRPAAPATIRCTEGKLEPNAVSLGPLQGLVVQIGAPARIVIELVEPDDGPGADETHGGDDNRPVPKGRRRVASYERPTD
jgi:hypothetical protein